MSTKNIAWQETMRVCRKFKSEQQIIDEVIKFRSGTVSIKNWVDKSAYYDEVFNFLTLTSDQKLRKSGQFEPDSLIFRFGIGNDPEIKTLPRMEGPIALVAISGLRAVEIACRLSELTQEGALKYIPQIYLIDYSARVCRFWNAMKKIFGESEDVTTFQQKLAVLLTQRYDLISVVYDEKERERVENAIKSVKPAIGLITNFINSLLKSYKFADIKKIIQQTVVIYQDWGEEKSARIFTEISDRSRSGKLKVGVYASDIISTLIPEEFVKYGNIMLNNISLLKAKIEIHTILNLETMIPDKVVIHTDDQRQLALADLKPAGMTILPGMFFEEKPTESADEKLKNHRQKLKKFSQQSGKERHCAILCLNIAAALIDQDRIKNVEEIKQYLDRAKDYTEKMKATDERLPKRIAELRAAIARSSAGQQSAPALKKCK